MSSIYVNDPATNERVTLSELGRRHGISAGCLSRRYHRGERGQKLIEHVSNEELAKARAAEYRDSLLRQHRIFVVNTTALRLPFNHIAQARKMTGGAL